MTYGYKTLEDGTVVPYPIDTQLPSKDKVVSLSTIPAYCLHCPIFPERIQKFTEVCNKLNIKFSIIETNVFRYSRQTNIACGFLDLIIFAISKNQYPFLILEDDIDIIDNIPSNIYIPHSADIIYWGSNKNSGPPYIRSYLKTENYNTEYYRIYNSQSTHALLIPSYESANLIKNITQHSLITNEFHDIVLPNISRNKIFLTPKDGPYFYQNDGKNESITNFKWKTLIRE